MHPIVPAARNAEQPAAEPTAPVLEPIKPAAPKPAPRQPEQVVLGAKPTRYSNIEALLAKPAYQTRNSAFVVQTSGGRKEVRRNVEGGAEGRLAVRLTNRRKVWKRPVPGSYSTGSNPALPRFAR